jgi:hypothetical protein
MSRIFFIVIGIFIVIYVYSKVKKKLFSEKESIYWMIFSIFIMLLAIFPKLIDNVSLFFGIYYPPSFIFLIGFVFLLILLFKQSQAINLLNERSKELAQINAILDEEIRTLRKQILVINHEDSKTND